MGEQSNIVAYNFTATDQLSPVLQAQAQALQQLSTATTSHQAALSSLLTLTGQLANAQQQQTQTVTQGAAATQQAVQSTTGMAQAFQALAAQGTQTQQALNGVLALSQQLANAQQQTTAAVTAQTAAIGQLTTALNQAHTAQQTVVTSTTQAGSALQTAFGVAAGLGIFVSIQQIVGALKNLTVESTKLAARREDLIASFSGITGSSGNARDALRFLREEATRTSSDFDTLTTGYRNITAASRGTRVEGEATRTLFIGLTEATRVLGLSQAELSRVIKAVDDIITKGKVNRDDLVRQLGNSLPGVLNILARGFSVTTDELDKMITKGISAEAFVGSFGTQLRREFGPGLVLASQNASATFTRLGNEIKDISATIGSEILNLLKPSADAFAKLLEQRRLARERDDTQVARQAGGIDPGATEDERKLLLRLERQKTLFQSDTAAQREPNRFSDPQRSLRRIQEEIDQVKAGIESRRNPSATGDVPGGLAAGPAPFANQLDQLKTARQEVEQELALAKSIEKNAPALFAGTSGELERVGARLVAVRAGLEAIAKIVASTPGLLKELTPEFKASFEELNKQYKTDLLLQESIKARVETTEKLDGILKRSSREQDQQAEEEKRKRDAAIEQLGRISGQLDFPTTEKATAGLTDQLAVVEAAFPTDEQIGRQAEALRLRLRERELANEIVPELQNYFKAEQDLDELKGKAEQTQTRLNNAIERALQLAKAPREERTETRLREQFREAGVTPTTEQDARINFTTVIAQRRLEAERTADIYRDLGRTIESNLQNAFESAFTFGAQSGESLALSLAKSFQSLFAQLASQTTLNLLLRLLGQEPGGKSGGATGKIIESIVKAGIGLFAGSAGGNYGGLSQGFDTASQPYSFASGGIATRPQMALIGDNRSGFGEAIIPLSRNRAVPVELSGGGGSRAEQPIIVQVLVNNDYKGSIDPRVLRTTPGEITSVVAKNISTDGNLRQVIMQYAR